MAAALEAWFHLGKKDWLQSFVAVSMVEAINANSIVPTGGFSYQSRERLVSDLGIPRESLVNRKCARGSGPGTRINVRKGLASAVTNQATEAAVMDALKKTLVIDRAYRAGLAFAMNQIPC